MIEVTCVFSEKRPLCEINEANSEAADAIPRYAIRKLIAKFVFSLLISTYLGKLEVLEDRRA